MTQRIVRVRRDGATSWGLVDRDDVFWLGDDPYIHRLEPAQKMGALEELDVLAPVAPSKIIGVGTNYTFDADTPPPEDPGLPVLFSKPPSSVVGPGAVIEIPALSQKVEFEAELAVVIGRPCRSVSVEEAWSYVLGITAANDVSARDIQLGEHQWTRSKGFDTFTPLGPWIVTGVTEDVVGDLQVSCRVNSELCQQASTAQMIFTPSFLISHIAAVMTLMPGDVILTGTPAGSAALTAGDTVEVEVEEVGTLTNTVV
jgi:2-keto-4-pentenoate hydratase/2-oxohepta-3-ene-1,7-dioic acid hydratase in catechol pathway